MSRETPKIFKPPTPPAPPASQETEASLFSKEFERGLDESQARYLSRSGDLATQAIGAERGQNLLFSSAHLRESDLSPRAKDLIAKIMQETRREAGEKGGVENTAALASIEKHISPHYGTNEESEAAFEGVQRKRKLFETYLDGGFTKHETYWNTLFFPFNTEATRAYARDTLAGKTILLLGGGRSRLGEEMAQNGILPKKVLNADPFVGEPEAGADQVLPSDVTDEHFPDACHAQGVEQAEEIWAEYSVPVYLKDPEKIRQLFRNIDLLLANGGTARIWPNYVDREGGQEKIVRRKAAMIESLRELDASGRYEIIDFWRTWRPGFLLRKTRS